MLALIGSGEYLPPIEPVDRFLFDQLPAAPRVVCLPTAAGTEGNERINYWMNLGVQHFSRLGVSVEALPVIDRGSANDNQLANRILEANFVYLSGGHPDYLHQTLENSLVWKSIEQVLSNGGLLAGCSAGAMIMGERIPAFPLWQRSFNLLPGAVIAPHFDEIPNYFLSTLRLLAGREKPLVGIEGNTALFVNDTRLVVIGSGSVTIIFRGYKARYTAGQMIQWPPTDTGKADLQL